MIRTT